MASHTYRSWSSTWRPSLRWWLDWPAPESTNGYPQIVFYTPAAARQLPSRTRLRVPTVAGGSRARFARRPPTHPADQGRHAVWPARFVRVSSLIGGDPDAGGPDGLGVPRSWLVGTTIASVQPWLHPSVDYVREVPP